MGILLATYFLYKLDECKALLIRANRPGYSNANQNQANEAEQILDEKVQLLLKLYLEGKEYEKPQFIGMFQGLPEGDILYRKNGIANLQNLRYTTTHYSKDHIFISIADSEETFLNIISEEDFADNGWTKADMYLPSISVEATDFITENDADLSSIPNAYTVDLVNNKHL